MGPRSANASPRMKKCRIPSHALVRFRAHCVARFGFLSSPKRVIFGLAPRAKSLARRQQAPAQFGIPFSAGGHPLGLFCGSASTGEGSRRSRRESSARNVISIRELMKVSVARPRRIMMIMRLGIYHRLLEKARVFSIIFGAYLGDS